MNTAAGLGVGGVVYTGRALEIQQRCEPPRPNYAGGDARRVVAAACSPLNINEDALFVTITDLFSEILSEQGS